MQQSFTQAPTAPPAAPQRQRPDSRPTQEQQLLDSLYSDGETSLTLSVYFRPRADTLGDADAYRLQTLAKHLRHRSELQVNLLGRCDPNGTDEYNNVLAVQRALAVKHMLELFGVERGRIRHGGRGASATIACNDKHDAYKQYRCVEIVVTGPAARYSGAQVQPLGTPLNV